MEKKVWKYVTGVVLCLFGLSTVVIADNAGLSEVDHQEVLMLPKSEAEAHRDNQLAKEAQAILEIRTKAVNGEIPLGEYQQALSEFMRKWKPGKGRTRPSSATGDVSSQYTSSWLGVPVIGQETTYYCGPASAQQLLDYIGVPPSQSMLASDLHTTTDGTPWTGYWEPTLESYTGVGWTALSGPSESNLFYYTQLDVDGYWPLIYDTVQNSSNGYLPGYSSGTIYHYVTGDGYMIDDQNVKWVHYADPNKFRSGAFGYHWVTNNDMWKKVRDRGIVW